MTIELNPYLSFNGQCEAAFKFYERCLGGKIVAMMTYRGSPLEEQTPSGWLNKIMHARPNDAERIFHALSENGTVQMPIQKTFWAVRFGMLVDQFGTPWMINCEQPA